MKVKDLKSQALEEIEAEKIPLVVEKIKDFEKRMRAMEKAMNELNAKHEEFLETPLEDIETDDFHY
jgi:hypothetical protein